LTCSRIFYEEKYHKQKLQRGHFQLMNFIISFFFFCAMSMSYARIFRSDCIVFEPEEMRNQSKAYFKNYILFGTEN
jgi:hypothetical protein